jgi:hypothetical protein
MSKLEQAQQRYLAAMHAVQTGIMHRMEYDPKFVEQKHLLVGIVSNEVTSTAQTALLIRHKITERQMEQAALARLLIEKGVFTLEEYTEALARFAEDERAAYEHELSRHYQTKITLA